eukprot:2368830-Amphidinium_carterae.2
MHKRIGLHPTASCESQALATSARNLSTNADKPESMVKSVSKVPTVSHTHTLAQEVICNTHNLISPPTSQPRRLDKVVVANLSGSQETSLFNDHLS